MSNLKINKGKRTEGQKYYGQIMDLLLIAPIYPPTPGGGAQYSEYLVNHFSQMESVKSLEVLTEKNSTRQSIEKKGNNTIIKRTLFQFNSLPCRMKRRYFFYVIQNIQLAWILFSFVFLKKKSQPQFILLHAAFFIHPTVLIVVTRIIKQIKRNDLKLVLDVRDPVAPLKRLKKLIHFDQVITCCRRLTNRIQSIENFMVPVEEIPVPLEIVKISDNYVNFVLKKYGIIRSSYIFTSNGIVNIKSFPLIFDIWRELQNRGYKLDLIVAGHTRDWCSEYGNVEDEKKGKLFNLGPLENIEVRALMKGAAVVINPSAVEGMPRSSLEAMSLGTPVLLPPYVPEFEKFDLRFIARSSDPKVLANQVEWLIKQCEVAPYVIKNHDANAVASRYDELLCTLS